MERNMSGTLDGGGLQLAPFAVYAGATLAACTAATAVIIYKRYSAQQQEQAVQVQRAHIRSKSQAALLEEDPLKKRVRVLYGTQTGDDSHGWRGREGGVAGNYPLVVCQFI
jgi:hypothetical protein